MSSDSGERRLLPALLALSAVAFAGITLDEGFSGKASPPVKGDKPTYGFGSTMRPDGSPVRSGDTITPPAAIQLSLRQAEVKLVFVNGLKAGFDTVLRDGDRLGLFPAVGGG